MALTHEELGLVTKLKDKENFQIWKFQIDIILKSHELYKVVNEGGKPAETESDAVKAEWDKKDARAQKALVTTISQQCLTYVLNCKTSKEMYDKLKNIYEGDTEQRKCSLLQDFFNFTFKKGSSVSNHISELQNLVFKLKSLNYEIDDSMLMSKILSSLPEHYKHFISAWDSASKAEKTLNNLSSRLVNEETRLFPAEEEAIAFGASTSALKHVKCFKCNKIGHVAAQCKNKTQNPKVKCSICKKNNHQEKDCFFRKNKKEERKEISFLVNCENDDEFVVDSGSSKHMSHNLELFEEIFEKETEVKVAKKSEVMLSKGIGKIKTAECTLDKVLFIPELSRNLLSVNAVTENNGEVKFTKNKVEIYKNNEKVLEGKKEENGLYTIKLKKEESALIATEKSKMWHRRMGHISKENLMKLEGLSKGMTLSKMENLSGFCEICVTTKQTRLPFSSERKRATRPLEILHSDVCGPITPKTWDEKNYFVTFLDDYTHHTTVYLMKGKFEVESIMKEHINKVEAELNLKVAKVRCDNGGEYISKNVRSWCKTKGIVLDYTVPYSPQLNGKAERLNRTLLEKSRAIIADSGIDKEMWGEAVCVSAYLLNRSPSSTIENTPYQMWNLKQPDLSRIKIFGCDAYAKTMGNLKKLDDRSKKFKMVGYSINGYRLWDEQARKITIHRDVIFNEESETGARAMIELDFENLPEEETEIKENHTTIKQIKKDVEENENSKNETEQLEEEEEENKIRKTKRQIRIPEKLREDYDLNYYAMLTYEEAINGPNRQNWLDAIEEEKNSLKKNETWKLVDKSEVENRKILTSKWVFRIKDDQKYKARLVVRGFEQEHGLDYQETFSPVINSSSLRTIFALAAIKRYEIYGFDIKTAFLYGTLDEDIFMELPKGYEEKNQVCKLQKALYGLKQAPLKWNEKFTSVLKQMGLTPIKSEKCIFNSENSEIILGIYVDDGVLIGKNKNELKFLLDKLKEHFEVKEKYKPTSFLGMEIENNENCLKLKQARYAENVLERFKMSEANSTSTPIVINNTREVEIDRTGYPYREAVGSLLYLANKTRPDLSYAVSFESRNLNEPNVYDVASVKRTMRYLKGTTSNCIVYKKNASCEELVAYSDADYAGDLNTRRSTTGYIIFYCGGPIAWCSRKQPIVALSSTEAEYIAAADCVKELLYLKNLLEEILNIKIQIELNVDNLSAINIIKNGVVNKRSKHIDVRYYFIHEKVADGTLKIKHCPSNLQLADFLTKPLTKDKFNLFCNNIFD